VTRCLLLLALLLPATAAAEFPMPTFPDCGTGGGCPSDFDPWGDWNLSSVIPDQLPPGRIPAEEAVLGSGLWADRAWNREVGDPSVIIAVLDSGIEWDHSQLLQKHWINRGELPLPQIADGSECAAYDCDGNGVFNVLDYALDPRIDAASGINATAHPDSVLDPSDLIAAFSDGTDADGNGYVDDISGWDFFWNDNNPYDDTRYGHGTGEAQDSSALGNDGAGDIGTCPNCMVLNLRVSDSFVADANNFANAVYYGVDMGAMVVQEALGALNNTPHTVAAIDYAWARGRVVIASAADETAYHQNYPGNNHHTYYVHAIRYDTDAREDATTFFAYSNCTNHGPRLVASAPSTSCSSGATGVSAGVAGLMFSAAKHAQDAGTIDAPLTGNEAYQVMAQSYDDIDFVHRDDDPDLYPSWPGWDRYFGYGRLNAKKVVDAVLDGAIPPEADLLTPTWFEVLDPTDGPFDVHGFAAASRSTGYTWSLQVAAGSDPREDAFQTVADGAGTTPTEGVLHALDLSAVPVDADAVLPPIYPSDNNVSKEEKAFAHAATLRLQVRDADGRLGEMRKLLYIQTDPDALPGFPRRASGGGVDGSPTLVDVDGDGQDDVVWNSSEGYVHVTDWQLQDLPGWPQAAPRLEELDPEDPANHLAQPAYAVEGEAADQRHAIIATPAVGDLDGDGVNEVVVGTLNGALLAWHADGTVVEGFPFWLDRSLVDGTTDPDNVWDYGFFASCALGDLDGDGDLEIVVGAMDGRLYALNGDGSLVDGFPVELRTTYSTADGDRSNGERSISSPALGDVDGDGTLEIALGTNEKTTGTYGLAYLVHHDGTIDPNWPASLFGAYTNALPYVGEGVPGAPTMCDVDGDGTLEIATHTIADSGKILSADGSEYARLARVASDFGPSSNTHEAGANLIMINSGAWGDMDQDGAPDYLIGSAGFDYALGLLDDGQRVDHDHLLSAWSGASTEPGRMAFLTGFPQVMEDMQFFLNPSVADIDGDGFPEAVNGSAGNVVHAFDHTGQEPVGWPKLTGQWILGSPAIGDADGDGYLDVWVATRSGFLYAWSTSARADTSYRGWSGFRHDPRNTGNCHTPLRSYPPPPPVEEPPVDDGAACTGCAASLGGSGGGLALSLLFAVVRRRRPGPQNA
jgi:hypothetical protein